MLAVSENPSHIAVDMGPVYLDWFAVPLASETNTLSVDLGPLAPVPAICHSIGNPHAVLFVADAEAVDLGDIGPQLENHPLFPDGANISFVHQVELNKFRMRVWERGGGITLACGSETCAVAVCRSSVWSWIAKQRNWYGWRIGFVEWQDDGTNGGRVMMQGPVSYVFDGRPFCKS